VGVASREVRHRIRSHIHRRFAKSQSAQARNAVAGLAINPSPAIRRSPAQAGFFSSPGARWGRDLRTNFVPIFADSSSESAPCLNAIASSRTLLRLRWAAKASGWARSRSSSTRARGQATEGTPSRIESRGSAENLARSTNGAIRPTRASGTLQRPDYLRSRRRVFYRHPGGHAESVLPFGPTTRRAKVRAMRPWLVS
jgi:hypothetical protein